MRMKKLFLFLLLMLTTVGVQAQSWAGTNPDMSGSYNHSTVFYVTLQTNLNSPSLNVAAFVGDECRASVYPGGDAAGATTGGNTYTIRVWGDKTADIGKSITFRVFDTNLGLEYTLTTATQYKFDGETYGEPSNPLVFTLTAPTSYTLNFPSEIEVGQSYILKNYLTVDEGATMPDNLTWKVTIGDADDASNYAKVVDNAKVIGVAPYQGLMLSLVSQFGAGMPLATCMFNVVQYATEISLLQTYIKVNRYADAELTSFMQPGVSYKILPEGATGDVKWDIEDPTIIETSAEGGMYRPVKGGTTRMRPYLIKKDGSKLYPANDAWITVTVIVPVERIDIDYNEVFQGTFKANVGDVKLYERMKRIIKIYPEEATDKTYEIFVDEGSSNLITKIGNTTFTAKAAGAATLTVKANGGNTAATDGGNVTAQINVQILDPTTQATIGQNSITTTLQDGDPRDITEIVQGNVQLNGDGSNLSEFCSVSIEGTSVSADGAALGMTGLMGTYRAVAEGTTTFTIKLSWINYDEWGVSSDAIQYKSAQPAIFKVVVTNKTTLLGFDVAVKNAIAGKTGTITLTPVPAGATFDPADITVKMTNGLEGDWGALLSTTKKNPTQSQIVYEFYSPIPCMVTVNAFESGTNRINLNNQSDATSAEGFHGFEIAYPLSLAEGWQWRSNPVGVVVKDSFDIIYANVIEIRTKNDLLYNDSQWGLFGTLNNAGSIKQGQCYKIKMKSAQESLLYGSSVTNANYENPYSNIEGTATDEGKITVTLNPGWNWVGSPYLFNRKLANIIGSSYANTLGNGAVIVGKTGSAEYKNGAWNGDLTVLKSGEGYLIKNPSTSAVDLVFASEKNMTPQNETVNGVKSAQMAGRVWQYDHTRFMDNMTMVAVFDNLENADQYSIGAFVGSECRGEGIIVDGIAYITVHCDAGEYVSFNLYNTWTGEYRPVKEGLKVQTRVGSLDAPFHMNAASVDGIEGISNDAESANESYDLSGRRMSGEQRGVTIRRMSDGSMRKMIVK